MTSIRAVLLACNSLIWTPPAMYPWAQLVHQQGSEAMQQRRTFSNADQSSATAQLSHHPEHTIDE